MSRTQLLLAAVQRGKYALLYHYLAEIERNEWSTTFAQIEQILGFTLPNSARIYRPWWANGGGSGHSQSMAWTMAGWKSADVDMDAETLTFRKDIQTHTEANFMVPSISTPRSLAPRMDDFRLGLQRVFRDAQATGKDSVIVRAGDFHRDVGGYPTPFNRMPMCCKAMYEVQGAGDRTLAKPKKEFGASLVIEYVLPRR